MEPAFWHARWQENRIGFHLPEANPLLIRYWPVMQVAPGSNILVPLCGKSLDMLWLLDQGYRVTGVEISRIAVEAFFAENRPAFAHEGQFEVLAIAVRSIISIISHHAPSGSNFIRRIRHKRFRLKRRTFQSAENRRAS